MNSCLETRTRLLEALDDRESTAPESAQQHLAECAACRVWWEQTREVEALLRASSAATPPAPESLLKRVQSSLAREPVPMRQAIPRSTWLAAAAAVLVVAGVSALLVLSRSGQLIHSLAPPTGQGHVQTIPSYSVIPSLNGLERVARPVEEVRQDFRWLTEALVSNAESAARAFAPPTDKPPTTHPATTPAGREKSVFAPDSSRATRV